MSAFPPISYREIRASSPSNPIPEDEVSPSLREGQGGESMVLDEQRQQQYQQQQYLVSNSADTTLILDEKPGRMPIMSLSD